MESEGEGNEANGLHDDYRVEEEEKCFNRRLNRQNFRLCCSKKSSK